MLVFQKAFSFEKELRIWCLIDEVINLELDTGLDIFLYCLSISTADNLNIIGELECSINKVRDHFSKLLADKKHTTTLFGILAQKYPAVEHGSNDKEMAFLTALLNIKNENLADYPLTRIALGLNDKASADSDQYHIPSLIGEIICFLHTRNVDKASPYNREIYFDLARHTLATRDNPCKISVVLEQHSSLPIIITQAATAFLASISHLQDNINPKN